MNISNLFSSVTSWFDVKDLVMVLEEVNVVWFFLLELSLPHYNYGYTWFSIKNK